uniref:Uncharacterized protein n=1 Tax=Zea mays TaxID=4577 RepID=C0HJ99_MAIZE|nr:unknown [Zea mays]
MRAATAAATGFFSPSTVPPRRFSSVTPPASLCTARCIQRHRLRAFPSLEIPLEELNPSVDLLRRTAEAVGDFRKTPIYIVGTDCTAKRNIAKLLANSIIYRYLSSEELLEDVLGGKDALRAFKESDEKGYLEVEVLSFFLPHVFLTSFLALNVTAPALPSTNFPFSVSLLDRRVKAAHVHG